MRKTKKYFSRSAYWGLLSFMALVFCFYSSSQKSFAAAPTGSSAVLQNSSSSTVDLVVTGTSFSTFVSSGTTTANSTDRAKITWKSTNPTAAVINSSTTITLTFSTSPVGTSVSGSLTIAADAVQDGSSVHNALITITSGSITDSAPPVVDAITNYIDLDHNGTVDYFTINFSEALATCTIEAGDWTIVTPGQVGLSVPTGCSSYLGNWLKFNTVGTTGVTGGNTAPQLSYSNQGTLGSLKDAAGNEVANTGTLTFSDSAIPVIKSFTYQDGDTDGKIDRVLITFTESLHSLTVLRPTDLTFTNVGDFTGAAFGSSTTDAVTGSTTTATIVFGTEATAIDTSENSGNIAVSSQNGFTLTDQSLNGNIILGAQTQASFIDGAAPVYVSSKTLDNNQNGTVDYIQVTYSESINDASVAATDFEAGFTGVTSGALVESFSSSAPGSGVLTDTANDELIYVGITSGTDVIAPNKTDYTLHIAQTGSVADASSNTLATFSEKTSTDGAAPALYTSTTIDTYTTDTTPTIFFSIIEDGTLSYSGGCTMPLTTVTAGAFLQAFDALAEGTYTCSIRGTDALGNISAPLTLNTFTIDLTAPIISAISAAQNGEQASISWTTNEITSSKVNYGNTTSYGFTTPETDTAPRVTTHTVVISGLSQCATYHFRPRSSDGAGNEAVGSDIQLENIGLCSGGLPAGALNKPTPPEGGYKITVKEGTTVATPTVTLSFATGNDVTKIALSNNSDFTNSGIEPYSPTKAWNICWQNIQQSPTTCPAGIYTIYAKFYTTWGQSSEPASIKVVYNPAAKGTPPQEIFAVFSVGKTVLVSARNKVYGFASEKAFLGLGYTYKMVKRKTVASMPSLDGILTSSQAAHIPGSWVSIGKTVYYITEAGKIPVPSWSLFISNNGKSEYIIKANSFDSALPELSPLEVSDKRL